MNKYLIRLIISGALLISAASFVLTLVGWLDVGNGRMPAGEGAVLISAR